MPEFHRKSKCMIPSIDMEAGVFYCVKTPTTIWNLMRNSLLLPPQYDIFKSTISFIQGGYHE